MGGGEDRVAGGGPEEAGTVGEVAVPGGAAKGAVADRAAGLRGPDEQGDRPGNWGSTNKVTRWRRRYAVDGLKVIGAFIERQNNGWLLQWHGYLTLARARQKLSRRAA